MRALIRTPCPGRTLAGSLLLIALSLVLSAAGTVNTAQAAGPRTSASPTPSTTTTGTRYVALGDSFASGQGLAPYETGTDTPADDCHRSASGSYPELLQRTRLRTYEKGASVACSGALTGSILLPITSISDEPAQIAALSSRTHTVTLTVGGNDAAFRLVLTDCIYSPLALPQVQAVVPGRPGCRARDDDAVAARIRYLMGDPDAGPAPGSVPLLPLLLAVQTAAPNATILVSGYPQLFGTETTDAQGCAVGALGPIGLYVTADDAQWIRHTSDDLNAAIRSAVQQARGLGGHLRYIDAAHAFRGHNVCDKKSSWVNPLVLTGGDAVTVDPASFHPTARGQQAYAEAFLRAARTYRDW